MLDRWATVTSAANCLHGVPFICSALIEACVPRKVTVLGEHQRMHRCSIVYIPTGKRVSCLPDRTLHIGQMNPTWRGWWGLSSCGETSGDYGQMESNTGRLGERRDHECRAGRAWLRGLVAGCLYAKWHRLLGELTKGQRRRWVLMRPPPWRSIHQLTRHLLLLRSIAASGTRRFHLSSASRE